MRRLPQSAQPVGHLAPGAGERHDCGRYEQCLDAFVMSQRGVDRDAHCPVTCPCRGRSLSCDCHGTGCRWHERPHQVRATEYLAAHRVDASIYCGVRDD